MIAGCVFGGAEDSFLMKLSIRDLLLMTVIVALAVGWRVDRSRLAQRAHEAEEQSAAERRMLDLMDPDRGERSLKEIVDRWPDSSAPAPNSPKN